jgi:hypothetical protein
MVLIGKLLGLAVVRLLGVRELEARQEGDSAGEVRLCHYDLNYKIGFE